MITMESVSLEERRTALKQQLEAGAYRPFIDTFLEASNRVLCRLTRSGKPLPLWYAAITLSLLQALISFVLALVLGEVPIYRVVHHGILPAQLVGGTVLFYLLFTISILLVEARFRDIFHTLAGQLLDKVVSEADLLDLQRWLSAAIDARRPLLFALAYTLVIVPYNLIFLSQYLGAFIGVSGISVQVFTCITSGFMLYYLYLMMSFHARIQNYHFQLYPLDPSSSEVIHILSRILSRNELLIASIIAMSTLGFGLIGVLNVYAYIVVPVGWIPVLLIFILHYSSLDRIIRRAKQKTLYDLQGQIEQVRSREALDSKDGLEHINKLMDFYDRVNNTNNSAINLRAGLTLLNSLFLPVIGFLIGNTRTILTLLGLVK